MAKYDNDEEKRTSTRKLSYILIGFSVLYFLTALILDFDSGLSKREDLPGTGGIVGPMQVGKKGAVLQVKISQFLHENRSWSFITGELLDSNKNYLTGFGDELFYEEGWDDGHWVESERDFEDKLTIEKPGKYYFKFNVESNEPASKLPPLRVEITRKLASSVPHFAGGLILLIIGIVLNLYSGGILRTLFGSDD
jgi:hypothetical protein